MLISTLQKGSAALSQIGPWRPAFDGFGEGAGPVAIAEAKCPLCDRSLPIIRRTLESGAYNLPDAAVYRRLLSGSYCIALGDAIPNKTTPSRRPGPTVRSRWQGMLWHVYQVAFLDVVGNEIGPFEPADEWAIGRPPDQLEMITDRLRSELRAARSGGNIPAYKPNGDGDSRETERRLQPILTRVLESWSYRFVASDRQTGIIPAFWWGHYVDLLYKRGDGDTLSVEVKVKEDWEHPVNEPLGALLRDNAVLNIRVGTQGDNRSPETRRLVAEAESRLSPTGRAVFLHIP